jgi:hypothetical protein
LWNEVPSLFSRFQSLSWIYVLQFIDHQISISRQRNREMRKRPWGGSRYFGAITLKLAAVARALD